MSKYNSNFNVMCKQNEIHQLNNLTEIFNAISTYSETYFGTKVVNIRMSKTVVLLGDDIASTLINHSTINLYNNDDVFGYLSGFKLGVSSVSSILSSIIFYRRDWKKLFKNFDDVGVLHALNTGSNKIDIVEYYT